MDSLRAKEPELAQMERRVDLCAVQTVRRIAAMLDLDPDAFHEGALLPRGWHFFLLAGETRRSHLRPDGFPGFGVPVPELGLPRLVLGGRTVHYRQDIMIGAAIEKVSRIASIANGAGRDGPRATVTLEHEIWLKNATCAAVVETQTYVLLPEARRTESKNTAEFHSEQAGEYVFTPDETLLFQYSALGFNSHKIHLDRTYARDVEGLPDLVVNGGLATLLASEFLRRNLGVSPREVRTRHTAPLFVGRPITFVSRQQGRAIDVKALDSNRGVAMHMEVQGT